MVKIDRGDLEAVVSSTGTLSAVTTVQVGTQVSGRIAKIHADFNQAVKQGQLTLPCWTLHHTNGGFESRISL